MTEIDEKFLKNMAEALVKRTAVEGKKLNKWETEKVLEILIQKALEQESEYSE